jgi:hypothetical protein
VLQALHRHLRRRCCCVAGVAAALTSWSVGCCRAQGLLSGAASELYICGGDRPDCLVWPCAGRVRGAGCAVLGRVCCSSSSSSAVAG